MNIVSAKWFAATPIEQRIELGKQSMSGSASIDIANKHDQAKRYLQEWHEQPPFNDGDYFSKRLSTLGVTEDELVEILSYPLAAVQRQFDVIPAWLQRLNDVFARYDLAEWQVQQKKAISERPVLGFLIIAAPFIQEVKQRLNESIAELNQKYSHVSFISMTVSEMFCRSLYEDLLEIVSRALILELNLAKKLGRLTGQTPEERFMSFVELLAQTDFALDILGSYPVMAEQIATYTEQWLTVRIEFLNRLCNDYYQLQVIFSVAGKPLGELVAVEDKLSDPHWGGRTVMIATFSGGEKIVYKPKSLLTDSRFQELLRWFNDAQNKIFLRLTKLLLRETYGWCEYFEVLSCDSEEAMQCFYRRMGANLAILYSLKATDFHSENIIAFGEYPILIDLETLFHNQPADISFDGATRQVGERLQSSVMTIGLLPEKLWGSGDGEGIDVSALGAKRRQASPIRGITLTGVGTDEMGVKYDFIGHEQNVPSRPLLHGEEVDLGGYARHLEDGFITFYQLITHNREAYIELVTSLFQDTSVRCIVRPTQLYYMLRKECYNPKFQRDSLTQNKLLDKLWLHVKDNPKLVNMIASERHDIRQGDYPIFTGKADSRHLWDSRGKKFPNFFETTGLQSVKNVIRRFGEEDLQEQLWLIRTSMASFEEPVKKPLFVRPLETDTTKERLLKTACDLVEQHLQPLATREGDELAWLVYRADPRRGWSVTQADMNLYDGVNGIALFLAYLGHITGEGVYTSLAESSVHSLHSQMQHNLEQYELIGALEGWGSVIYGLTHLGVLWRRPELLVEAAEIASVIPDLIERDSCLDILAGSAGCIAMLLNLYQVCPQSEFLKTAQACGEHLLNTAMEMPVGIGWKNHIAKEIPFSGFSHGAAGIAWSLLRLTAVTGDGRFHDAAMQAIAYERSLYLPPTGNWQDLRPMYPSDTPVEHQCALAWCHGAPGIGLGRLLSLPYLGDDPFALAEIDTAVKTTLKHGFGSYHPGFGQNYSLCHGDLGNLDIMLEISLRLDTYAHLESEIYGWAAIILDSMAEHGWLCGVPHGLLTPGLMTGLAGIGYGLLRLAAPGQVPSVLALEAPMLNPNHLTSHPGKESLLLPI